MTEIQAGDFVQSKCTKCKTQTKHIVVGLVDGVPSKVQCTFCKGNHNYRPETATETAAAAKKRARPPAKPVENADWKNDSPGWDAGKAVAYARENSYRRGDLINHSHFGLGMVKKIAGPKRMQVLFETGEKLMQCGN